MVRSHAAAAGIGCPMLPPRPPKPPPPPPPPIAGTPTHGYAATREAGMSLISLNVRFQGQPGPHLLALSFSQFDPQRKCRDPSFDDFVGQRKQHRRHTVRPSAVAVFEIDDEFKLGRCSHRLS